MRIDNTYAAIMLVEILYEKGDETSEDDESSVHNRGNNHGKCSFFEKKYSREWLPHRQLSLRNNII